MSKRFKFQSSSSIQGQKRRLVLPALRDALHGLDIDRVLDLYNECEKDGNALLRASNDPVALAAAALIEVREVKKLHGPARIARAVDGLLTCRKLGLRGFFIFVTLVPSRVTAAFQSSKPSVLARSWLDYHKRSCDSCRDHDNPDYFDVIRTIVSDSLRAAEEVRTL